MQCFESIKTSFNRSEVLNTNAWLVSHNESRDHLNCANQQVMTFASDKTTVESGFSRSLSDFVNHLNVIFIYISERFGTPNVNYWL